MLTSKMVHVSFLVAVLLLHLGTSEPVPNACESNNPCENGGTCEMGNTGYSCKCPDGFSGDNCEHQPEPCLYNGVNFTAAATEEDLSIHNDCDDEVHTLDICLSSHYDQSPLKQCFFEQSCLPACCDYQNGEQQSPGFAAQVLVDAWSTKCSESAGLSSNLNFHLIKDFILFETIATAFSEMYGCSKGCQYSKLTWEQLAPTLTSLPSVYARNETARGKFCLQQHLTGLQEMEDGFQACIKQFKPSCLSRYLATVKALYDQVCPTHKANSCQIRATRDLWGGNQMTCREAGYPKSLDLVGIRFCSSSCPGVCLAEKESLMDQWGSGDLAGKSPDDLCAEKCHQPIENLAICVESNADLSSHFPRDKWFRGLLDELHQFSSTTFKYLLLGHLKECSRLGESDSHSSDDDEGSSFDKMERTIQRECFQPLEEAGCFPGFVTEQFRNAGCAVVTQYLKLKGTKKPKKIEKAVKAFCNLGEAGGDKCGRKGGKKGGSSAGKKGGSSAGKKGGSSAGKKVGAVLAKKVGAVLAKKVGAVMMGMKWGRYVRK